MPEIHIRGWLLARNGRGVLQVEGTRMNKIMGVMWQDRKPRKIRNKTEESGRGQIRKSLVRVGGATGIFRVRTTGSYVLYRQSLRSLSEG